MHFNGSRKLIADWEGELDKFVLAFVVPRSAEEGGMRPVHKQTLKKQRKRLVHNHTLKEQGKRPVHIHTLKEQLLIELIHLGCRLHLQPGGLSNKELAVLADLCDYEERRTGQDCLQNLSIHKKQFVELASTMINKPLRLSEVGDLGSSNTQDLDRQWEEFKLAFAKKLMETDGTLDEREKQILLSAPTFELQTRKLLSEIGEPSVSSEQDLSGQSLIMITIADLLGQIIQGVLIMTNAATANGAVSTDRVHLANDIIPPKPANAAEIELCGVEQLKSLRRLINLVDSTMSTIEKPLAYMLHKVIGEELNTPQTQLANEISALGIFVRLRLGDLTLAQCESFCKALGRLQSKELDACRYGQVCADSAISDPEFWEYPPTLCLSLLRQYDADHSSKHAVALQTMLLDLSGLILAPHVDSERQLLSELQKVWEEVVTARRMAENCLNPGSPVLIEDINLTVDLLLNPLSEEVKSYKEFAGEVQTQTMDHWLRFQLFFFACTAVNVDEKPRKSAIELLYDLAPTFGIHAELGTIPHLRGLFIDGQIPRQFPAQRPKFLVLLESYDDYCGSDYANTARQLLSKLAIAIFSTNGPLSDRQIAWLSGFDL